MSPLIDIRIFQGHAPELPPSDVNIVIDVIRAFTTTHIAFENGVEKIVLAGEVAEARALAADHPDYVLAGERDALEIDGFDMGNSPHACAQRDLQGRTMILTTTNGVRATLHAIQSMDDGRVFVTGFSNAARTAAYVRGLARPAQTLRINLIASNPTDDDDRACAEFIRDRLLEDKPAAEAVGSDAVIRRIRECEAAQKFLNPARPEYDRRDVECCMTPRRSDFVMEAAEIDGRPVLTKRIDL
ncbi:MAG: 2-phosphosulfolactate phosphatase [Persicimonas sp.]